MAKAIITGLVQKFGGVPYVEDEATNGWLAKFQVFYVGSGASGNFMFDEVTVHFLDTDAAFTMDNKIRDAARARAVELGVTDGANISVVALTPPRRL